MAAPRTASTRSLEETLSSLALDLAYVFGHPPDAVLECSRIEIWTNAFLGERVDRWDCRLMVAAFRLEPPRPASVQVEVLDRWDTRDRGKNFTRTYTLELDKVRW